jgi:hypothetical protein
MVASADTLTWWISRQLAKCASDPVFRGMICEKIGEANWNPMRSRRMPLPWRSAFPSYLFSMDGTDRLGKWQHNMHLNYGAGRYL